MRVSRLERLMIAVTVVGLLALVISQALLTTDFVQLYFGAAEKIEGRTVNFYDEFPQTRETSIAYTSVFATVTVQVEKYSSLSKAVLLVNGEKIGDFRDKQVTVKVSPGDVLAVDGTFYVHRLEFRIAAASANVIQPAVGATVQVCGNVGLFDEVRLK